MANRKAALKTQRQDKKRHLRNTKVKREVKKALKEFNAYLTAKDTDKAKEFLPQISSKLDKAVKQGLSKKNTAARKKSRLTLSLHKIELAGKTSDKEKSSSNSK